MLPPIHARYNTTTKQKYIIVHHIINSLSPSRVPPVSVKPNPPQYYTPPHATTTTHNTTISLALLLSTKRTPSGCTFDQALDTKRTYACGATNLLPLIILTLEQDDVSQGRRNFALNRQTTLIFTQTLRFP